MDFDMTQAITFSDVEDDADKSKQPVAHLTILNHQTLKDKSYPIFRGKNIIGRQEHSCEIYIPVKSLSKKHACIEVTGRSHLLYDMSSRNKSRRGTLFLTPEVRYELKQKDTLVFADISCKYTIEEIARASDSGSDTESMSDLEDKFDDTSITAAPTATKSSISLELENSNSSSSSDILLPTQDFPVNDLTKYSSQGLQNVSPAKAEVLVIDSSPETQGESSYHKDRIFFQNNANKESNIDADILAAATQAYVADSDDDSKSEVYDTENPMLFIADTQPQISNHNIPEDLPKEPNKPQLNSSQSSQSQTDNVGARGGSEGFKMKSSSEMSVNTKPKEKLDDLIFMSTYKNDIVISDEELSPVSKSPEREPVTSTAHETLPETLQKPETPVDQDPNNSFASVNKSPESKPSPTVNKSTISSPVTDTISVESFQEPTLPVAKTLKTPSNTSTLIKETVSLPSTLMDTLEIKECISPEKHLEVAEPLKVVTTEAFSETLCVQEDKTETSSPIKEQTAVTNPNLSSVVSSPKDVHTECSENFNLDATQPYVLDSSFYSPNTKKLPQATPKTPVGDKTQPLRQSCGLDVEMANDSDDAMKDCTPVKKRQSESLVETPIRSRVHSISSDEESVTDVQNFKDKLISEDVSDDKSENVQENIPNTNNTLSGDLFASGKSSQTISATPSVTKVNDSGEPNTALLESLVPAVEEQTDLETRASEKPNVKAVSSSGATEEELPCELKDDEVSYDVEEDILKRSKRLKIDDTTTPVPENSKKLPRNTGKNTKSTDISFKSVEIPEVQSSGKRILRNHPETSDSHSNKKSKVRKSIKFDLPEDENSSQEENYSDNSSKNKKRLSNRSKKSSSVIKDDKGNKKLSESSDTKLTDVKKKEYSEDSKTEVKLKTGRGKRLKKGKNVIESEMEIDEDFVEKKVSKTMETTVEATESISFEVKKETVDDKSVLAQNMGDSRKKGRGLGRKSKQNIEKIQEEISDSSNASQQVDTVSEDSKVTRRSGRASRSKSVKDEKEAADGSVLATSSNNTPSGRGRSTRGAKKEVNEDKGKTKKAGKISLKKSLDSNKQSEENSNEKTKNINQKEEDMEIDEDGDSKTKSNIEGENTEDQKSSRSRTQRNKRKQSEEEAESKISEKNSKKKKIVSNEETEESSENSSCSLKQRNVPMSKDHAGNLNVSTDVSTDITTPSKTTLAKRVQSKRQLSHSQDTKDETSGMQELKTPGKRKENPRTSSSQSNNESNNMATPKHLKSNQFVSPRRNNGELKLNVMFTGLTDDRGQKIVTDLGGTVGTNYTCCTHLVTDKVRRTVKFLCCLARGIPIISLCWLTKCKSAKTFIDYTPYILSDSDAENQYNFSLSQSLQLARSLSPLKGYKIHVTKSVKPNAEQMKEIIESCKAKFLVKLPTEFKEETIVISCEEDKSSCGKALQAGIPIVEAEFLLTGILQQDLSINKYRIFLTSPTNEKCKPSPATEKKSRSTRKTKK